MPHLDVPIWLASILVASIIGIVIHDWRTVNKKFKDIEQRREEELKTQIEKGGIMSMSQHATICQTVVKTLAETFKAEVKGTERLLSSQMDAMKENFDLKLDNIILLVGKNNVIQRKTKKSR
jgi:hypothetical protein